jgi:bacteriocin biosynthesis cyclodehydratase domain-containing protein
MSQVEVPRKPRLKAAIELVPASDGRIYFLRGEVAGDLAVADTPFARELLDELRAGYPLEEVVERVPARVPEASREEVVASVSKLAEAGVIEDAAGDETLTGTEQARYDRQLRYFAELMPMGATRADYQLRLREAHVVVLGVGGLGSWAAYGLACAGIGSLSLVDGDRLEMSNLNRQVLYSEAGCGGAKAQLAAERLLQFNPSIEVRPVQRRLECLADVEAVVDGADFVVDAADWPAYKIDGWVNQACFERAVPFTAMGQLPPLIRLGPTYVPGQTGCHDCREAAFREDYPLYDELAEAKSLAPSPAPTFGPACGIIGAHAAMEAVHYLSGICTPSTLGRAVTIDLRTLAVSAEDVPKRPDCPVCAAREREHTFASS